jgi:hypothetical protein
MEPILIRGFGERSKIREMDAKKAALNFTDLSTGLKAFDFDSRMGGQFIKFCKM